MNFQKKIELASQLGKSGHYRELEDLCRLLLKKKPKDFNTLQFLGTALSQQDKVTQAIPVLKKAMARNSRHVGVRNNLGDAYLKCGEYTKAIELFRSVIRMDTKGHIPEARINLGVAYLETDQHENAVKALQTAIDLLPDNVEAYNNLGSALFSLKRHQEAENAYRQALSLNPDFALAADNLAVCLRKQGKLREALAQHLQANDLNQDLTRVYPNLFDTLMFLHDTKAAREVANAGLANPYLLETEKAQLLTRRAMLSWLTGDIPQTDRDIQANRNVMERFSDFHDIKNLRGYHQCIDLLLKERQKHPELYSGTPIIPLFFIGDSHSLGPSETIICYRKEFFRVLSSVIVGCKAWHLASEENNEFKTSLEVIIKALPEKASLVLAFGEIDCRLNEGILPAHLNKKTDYCKLLPLLIEQYLDVALKLTTPRQQNLILYGVPAPRKGTLMNVHPTTDKLLRDIIRLFNTLLQQRCHELGLDFLDIYSATCDDKGYSNEIYHIDDVHLHPKILGKLFAEHLF